MAGAVIGRDEELAAIGAFLDGVWSGPRALVFAGEAGIGKTLLWEAGVARAKERAGRVLSCRGAEAEASLSFAALSELVGPVFDEVALSLAGPRRRALAVALLLAEPVEERPDAHAIGLGVLDALRVLAADAPVVVALDDAQWLDPASADVLGVALRRLDDDHVGVLATFRTGYQTAGPLELEREERVARGRLVEPRKLKAGQLQREPLPEQLMRLAQAERTDETLLKPPIRKRPHELQRHRGLGADADGRQHTHVVIAQPPRPRTSNIAAAPIATVCRRSMPRSCGESAVLMTPTLPARSRRAGPPRALLLRPARRAQAAAGAG